LILAVISTWQVWFMTTMYLSNTGYEETQQKVQGL
jgi:hypothetical protein